MDSEEVNLPEPNKVQAGRLGDYLIRKGIATAQDVSNALLTQERIRTGIAKGEKLRDLKLGEILLRNNIITVEELEEAFAEQGHSGGSISTNLTKLGYVSGNEIDSLLSYESEIPVVNLLKEDIPENIIKLIPSELAIKYKIIPLKQFKGTLYLAISEHSKIDALDDIKFLTGLNVEIIVVSDNEIASALSKYYYYNALNILAENKEYINSISSEDFKEEINVSELESSSSEEPIIKFVNKVLLDGVKMGASDIHIEPYESILRIRYRMDGKLIEQMKIPAQLKSRVISRLKIMSQLDIADKRSAQDGRIKAKMEGKDIDMRVSSLPTLFGEKIVIRILDKSNLQLDMRKLGFSEEQMQDFNTAIHSPYGMILVTGPTGSGKTTTLYSALSELNKPDVNISTAEDPVEYNIQGINQVHVGEGNNLTFASALRSFLRQDPDIIMVGEIRDLETAEIAIKAALTGHLVLSTIHTNNAASTISRLINMDVEPFLVASSLNLIIAQRLVRKLCNECKEPYYEDENVLTGLGFTKKEISGIRFYKEKGCSACNKTGYKGRIAIYEVLNISDDVKSKIYENASEFEIQAAAVKNGMKTLKESAKEIFLNGITSLKEIMQYVNTIKGRY